jgi:hypothetical protein
MQIASTRCALRTGSVFHSDPVFRPRFHVNKSLHMPVEMLEMMAPPVVTVPPFLSPVYKDAYQGDT